MNGYTVACGVDGIYAGIMNPTRDDGKLKPNVQRMRLKLYVNGLLKQIMLEDIHSNLMM